MITNLSKLVQNKPTIDHSHVRISILNSTVYLKLKHHDQVEFIPRMSKCFNISKTINIIYHVNGSQENIMFTDANMLCDKINKPILITTHNKVGVCDYFST